MRPAVADLNRTPIARTEDPRWSVIGGAAGLLAAVAYTSFLIAPLAGSSLSIVHSYISELGAPTQPRSGFFRATDLIAGCLILVLARATRARLPAGTRRRCGVAALVLVGLAAAVDGWHPMSCAPSIGNACREGEHLLGLFRQMRELHTLSGVVGVLAAIASMLLVGGLLRARHDRVAGEVGRCAAVAVAVLASAEVPLALADRWMGLVERTYVPIISLWIATLGVWLLVEAARDTRAARVAGASGSAPARRRAPTRLQERRFGIPGWREWHVVSGFVAAEQRRSRPAR